MESFRVETRKFSAHSLLERIAMRSLLRTIRVPLLAEAANATIFSLAGGAQSGDAYDDVWAVAAVASWVVTGLLATWAGWLVRRSADYQLWRAMLAGPLVVLVALIIGLSYGLVGWDESIDQNLQAIGGVAGEYPVLSYKSGAAFVAAVTAVVFTGVSLVGSWAAHLFRARGDRNAF